MDQSDNWGRGSVDVSETQPALAESGERKKIVNFNIQMQSDQSDDDSTDSDVSASPDEHDDDITSSTSKSSELPDGSDALSMWKLKLIKDKHMMQSTMNEFKFYLAYLTLTVLLVQAFPNATDVLRLVEGMEDQFLDEEITGETTYKKNFYDVMTKDEMWEWGGADGPVMHTLYPEQCQTTFSGGSETVHCARADEPQPVLLQNKLLGTIGIRQMRVTEKGESNTPLSHDWENPFHMAVERASSHWDAGDDCDCACCVGTRNSELFSSCDNPAESSRYLGWVNWTKDSAECNRGTATCDDAPFGHLPYTHSVFQSSAKGSPVFNRNGFTESYGYGGYGIELPNNRREAEKILRHLQQDFVDNRTRLVVFMLNFHNENTGIYTALQISFFFDQTGHVEKYARVNGIKPMYNIAYVGLSPSLTDGWTGLQPFALWIWIVITMYYILVEAKQCWETPRLYWKNWWNAYEVISLGTCVNLARLYWKLHTESKLLECTLTSVTSGDSGTYTTGEQFIDLAPIRNVYRRAQTGLALMAIFSIFKLFKFMRISNRFNFLWRSLHLAAKDLMAFLFIVMIMLCGLALFAVLVFGPNVRHFHNFALAFFSLIRWTTGDFFFIPFDRIQTADATIAPLFVTFFLLMVVLTSINMLVAILLDFYAMVKKEREEHREQKKQLGIGKLFSLGLLESGEGWYQQLVNPEWYIKHVDQDKDEVVEFQDGDQVQITLSKIKVNKEDTTSMLRTSELAPRELSTNALTTDTFTKEFTASTTKRISRQIPQQPQYQSSNSRKRDKANLVSKLSTFTMRNRGTSFKSPGTSFETAESARRTITRQHHFTARPATEGANKYVPSKAFTLFEHIQVGESFELEDSTKFLKELLKLEIISVEHQKSKLKQLGKYDVHNTVINARVHRPSAVDSHLIREEPEVSRLTVNKNGARMRLPLLLIISLWWRKMSTQHSFKCENKTFVSRSVDAKRRLYHFYRHVCLCKPRRRDPVELLEQSIEGFFDAKIKFILRDVHGRMAYNAQVEAFEKEDMRIDQIPRELKLWLEHRSRTNQQSLYYRVCARFEAQQFTWPELKDMMLREYGLFDDDDTEEELLTEKVLNYIWSRFSGAIISTVPQSERFDGQAKMQMTGNKVMKMNRVARSLGLFTTGRSRVAPSSSTEDDASSPSPTPSPPLPTTLPPESEFRTVPVQGGQA